MQERKNKIFKIVIIEYSSWVRNLVTPTNAVLHQGVIKYIHKYIELIFYSIFTVHFRLFGVMVGRESALIIKKQGKPNTDNKYKSNLFFYVNDAYIS